MIAWTAVLLWPVVSIILYQKMKLPAALCATLLGGYLLLPEGFSYDLPMLPPMDKTSVPALCALVLTFLALKIKPDTTSYLPGWLPRTKIVLGLFALLAFGTFGTARTNGDMLDIGITTLPGLRTYDAFSILLSLIVMLIPFILGRRVLASPEGQRTLLLAVVISALAYTVPALYEVRMSPQLHINVYGYFPSSFYQSVREGSFRPNVFLNHGLALAIFLTYAVIAALGLFRTSQLQERGKSLYAAGWLFTILVLCKSMGSLLITATIAPVALFFRPRTQLLVAACISGLVLTYPMLRAADLVPVDRVLSMVASVDSARAGSFYTRISNEDILLEKALERPVYGWGIWARNRIFNQWGQDVSITDGAWINEFGVGGWVRYIGLFGLLGLPIIMLYFRQRSTPDATSAILSLIMAAALIDLIPNSAMSPLVWLMAGATVGRLEFLARKNPATEGGSEGSRTTVNDGGQYADLTPDDTEKAPRYARQFPKKGVATPPAMGRAQKPRRKEDTYKPKIKTTSTKHPYPASDTRR